LLASAATTFDKDTLVLDVQTQLFAGSTGVNYQYQILRVAVWGQVLGSHMLFVEDARTLLQTQDIGSATFKAKAGFLYPPILQDIHSSEDLNSPLFRVGTSVDGNVDMRITLRIWQV